MSLLDKTFDRTLDAWTHAYMAPAWRGAHLEGWLFEDAQARRAAEARLAQAGVQRAFAAPTSRCCITSWKRSSATA